MPAALQKNHRAKIAELAVCQKKAHFANDKKQVRGRTHLGHFCNTTPIFVRYGEALPCTAPYTGPEALWLESPLLQSPSDRLPITPRAA
jgi:hypothetical protein